MSLIEKLKYFTLEKPVLYIAYIILGLGCIGYFLYEKTVPVYQSYTGTVLISSDSCVIELDQGEVVNVNGNIYIYSLDLSERMIVEQYEQDGNRIIFSAKYFEFEDNENIKFRIEVGCEKLFEKILINGGR